LEGGGETKEEFRFQEEPPHPVGGRKGGERFSPGRDNVPLLKGTNKRWRKKGYGAHPGFSQEKGNIRSNREKQPQPYRVGGETVHQEKESDAHTRGELSSLLQEGRRGGILPETG